MRNESSTPANSAVEVGEGEPADGDGGASASVSVDTTSLLTRKCLSDIEEDFTEVIEGGLLGDLAGDLLSDLAGDLSSAFAGEFLIDFAGECLDESFVEGPSTGLVLGTIKKGTHIIVMTNIYFYGIVNVYLFYSTSQKWNF